MHKDKTQCILMNDLKYLSDELKFQKDFELPVREYRLDPFGDFPSGKLLGQQNLNNDNLHLLCFNNGVYVFDLDHLVYYQKVSASSGFMAYLYLEDYQGINGERFPVHVFFKNDGVILAYKIDILTLEFLPICISERSDLSALNRHSIAVSSKRGIFVSQIGKTIYKWSYYDLKVPLGIFIPLQGSQLRYSTFMKDDDSIFFCAYKSMFSGDMIIEFSQYYPRTESFKPVKRVILGNIDLNNFLMKQINDRLILCVTASKTWNFTSDLKVSHRKNKGLPNNVPFFSLTFIRTVNVVRLHTPSDVFETANLGDPLGRTPINWRLKKVHSISSYSASVVDFSYEVRENLHVIIYARGLVVLVNSSTLQSLVLNCDYENKSYFSGQIAANQGSDLDTLLLCGASGDRYGFFEKRNLVYPPCKQIHPHLIRLNHTPVTNLWPTENGIFYESQGAIYNSSSNSDKGQNGIFVLKNGEVLKDENNTIVFIELASSSWGNGEKDVSSSVSWEEKGEFVTIIYKDGTLELLKYNIGSTSQQVLQFQLENWIDEATVISTSYDYRKKTFHVVAFVDYCRIFYCDNRNTSFEIPIEQNFQVAGLQIIDDYVDYRFSNRLISNVLIVVTSFDGQIRIYSAFTGKVILEIKSPKHSEFQLVKSPHFIIFYNVFEVILLRTCDLVYGTLLLPEIPYKIAHLNNNQICMLDKHWNLQFLEILGTVENPSVIHNPEYRSQFHKFDEYLPLQISLMSGCDNLVAIALKNYSSSLGLKLVLFDHIRMKTIKCHEIGVLACNVLLISYFDHLLLSYYEHDHSIVQIFDFNLQLIETMYIPHRITSLYLPKSIVRSIDSELETDIKNKAISGLPHNIIEKLYRYFQDPRNSTYKMVYETVKRPRFITWHRGKADEYRATDADILIDFIESRREPTVIDPENYKLYLTFNNHISIDNFKRLIPYEVLGVTPINEFIYNIQNGVSRSTYVRPLFLITCSHNAIYILCARYKEPGNGWRRNQ